MMENIDVGFYIRTCPKCLREVRHRNKAKWRTALKNNTMCIDCSRSNMGKSNALVDKCPICNEVIRVSFNNQTDLEAHARLHNLTSEELWLKKEGNKERLCRCGCGQKTRWVNWWHGYSEFICGHNGNIYSSYSEEEAQKISEKRSRSLSGIESWSKGLTKASSEKIKLLGEAISKGRKAAFASGRIKQYNKFSIEDIKERLAKNKKLLLLNIGDYKNCTDACISVKCIKCNTESIVSFALAISDRCRICNPIGSIWQHNVSDWIEENLSTIVERNYKLLSKYKETDIYMPAHKLAIETNGIWWHNTRFFEDVSYHQTKTDCCKKLGVRLIHIFEDEWRDKKEIVQSNIMSHANEYKHVISDTDCTVVSLDESQKSSFFKKNHIDGDDESTKAWGLCFNNNVVYAISVKNTKRDTEIVRACCVLNTKIENSCKKLIDTVVQYAYSNGKDKVLARLDERFFNEFEFYERLGFVAIEAKIKTWLCNGTKRFNNLSKLNFSCIDFDLDSNFEEQIFERYNLYRIHGCFEHTYVRYL